MKSAQKGLVSLFFCDEKKSINQSILKYKSSLFLTNDQIIIGKSNVTVGK
jgi:hypothetical protein